MSEIGIITEQGDLGLGFDLLNKKDRKTYSESTSNNTQTEEDKRREK